jgi:hypothetical protein
VFVSPTKLETDRLAALAAQKELDAANEERHIARHEVDQARARDGNEAWIRSGLAAGATVIVYPDSAVRDGVAVNVRKL